MGCRSRCRKIELSVLPPTREVTTEVRVADETAEVIALPISSPGLIAMPDARPLNGDLPVFPEARPQSPIRTISPGALPAEEPAQTTQEGPEVAGTFVDLDPVTTASSARSSEALSGFEDSRAAFATGDFARVVMNLQEIVAAGDLGPRAPEGYYMLGVAYLRQGQVPYSHPDPRDWVAPVFHVTFCGSVAGQSG